MPTTSTPFLSPARLDALLRTGTPEQAADELGSRMEALRIKLVTSHDYLDSENSAVCAMGATMVLLAGEIDALEYIDLDLDDGDLIGEVEGAIDDDSPRGYHVWLMDHTLMTLGEVMSLETGFEGRTYDSNPAGVTDVASAGDILRFYQIGSALRMRHSISENALLDDDDDDDDDDYDYDEDADDDDD